MKKNKFIFVIGASGRIGYEITKYFLIKDKSLLICSSKKKSIIKTKNRLVKEFPDKVKNIKHCVLDVSNNKSIDKVFEKLKKNSIEIETVVNCAGIIDPIGEFKKADFKNWVKSININFLGPAYFYKKFINYRFKKAKRKNIIQFSGGGATRGIKNLSAYSVSKTAIVRLMEQLSIENNKNNFYFNAIAPGIIKSKMTNRILNHGKKKVEKKIYKKTFLKIQQGGDNIDKTLKLIDYLISNKNTHINGKLISSIWDNFFLLRRKKKIKNDLYTLTRNV